ncbi:hypothetical protein DFH08DRAFT_662366, partial [Mycena albidolilacea]
RRQNSQIRHPRVNDENIPPAPSNPPKKRARVFGSVAPPTGSLFGRQPSRSDGEKMKNVLQSIKAQGWSLGDFMYRLFRGKEEDEEPRSNQHAQMVSKFLKGDGDYSPADILTYWMKSPYGVVPPDSLESTQMYSTSTPYTAIRSVR